MNWRIKVGLWSRAVRAEFFSASVVPVAVGVSTAANRGYRNPGLAVIVLAGVILLHAASNLINDYFDDLNGSDRQGPKTSPFSGGSRVIQDGLLSRNRIAFAALICLIGGCIIGVTLAVIAGWPVLVLGALGILGGYLYSAPPVWVASRGLGEVLAGLVFGPLIVMGTHVVLTGGLDMLPFSASLPVGCLIASVLYLNEFPDREADRAVGKCTLAVRLKPQKSKRGYAMMLILAYLSIAVGSIVHALPSWVLLSLLTIPLGWRVWRLFQRDEDPARLARACASNIVNHNLTGLLLALALWLD